MGLGILINTGPGHFIVHQWKNIQDIQLIWQAQKQYIVE